MKKLILCLALISLSANAETVSATRIGNTTFFSNGVSAGTVGNTTFYSNGSTSTQIGDTTFINAPEPEPVYQAPDLEPSNVMDQSDEQFLWGD